MKKGLSVMVALVAVIVATIIALLAIPAIVVLLLSLLLHFTFSWNYVIAIAIIQLWFVSTVKAINIKNQ